MHLSQNSLYKNEYIFRKNVTENTLPKISTENAYTYSYDDYIVCLEKNALNFYNKSGKLINADVNAAYQIMKKVFRDAEMPADRGFVMNPLRVNFSF